MPAPVGRLGTRCPSHSSFAEMEGKRKFEDEEGLAVKKRKKDKSLKKAKKEHEDALKQARMEHQARLLAQRQLRGMRRLWLT